jgi:hypothetical protein
MAVFSQRISKYGFVLVVVQPVTDPHLFCTAGSRGPMNQRGLPVGVEST